MIDKNIQEEYYLLIFILHVSICALKYESKYNKEYFIENLLKLNEYVYHKLLNFGINYIGIPDEN